MANIKSAKKRILQSNKTKIRNKAVRTETRTVIKQFNHLMSTTADKDQLAQKIKDIERVLDKAASKKVIHKNKAARLKSKVHEKYNKLLVGEVKKKKSASHTETPQQVESSAESVSETESNPVE